MSIGLSPGWHIRPFPRTRRVSPSTERLSLITALHLLLDKQPSTPQPGAAVTWLSSQSAASLRQTPVKAPAFSAFQSRCKAHWIDIALDTQAAPKARAESHIQKQLERDLTSFLCYKIWLVLHSLRAGRKILLAFVYRLIHVWGKTGLPAFKINQPSTGFKVWRIMPRLLFHCKC